MLAGEWDDLGIDDEGDQPSSRGDSPSAPAPPILERGNKKGRKRFRERKLPKGIIDISTAAPLLTSIASKPAASSPAQPQSCAVTTSAFTESLDDEQAPREPPLAAADGSLHVANALPENREIADKERRHDWNSGGGDTSSALAPASPQPHCARILDSEPASPQYSDKRVDPLGDVNSEAIETSQSSTEQPGRP